MKEFDLGDLAGHVIQVALRTADKNGEHLTLMLNDGSRVKISADATLHIEHVSRRPVGMQHVNVRQVMSPEGIVSLDNRYRGDIPT